MKIGFVELDFLDLFGVREKVDFFLAQLTEIRAIDTFTTQLFLAFAGSHHLVEGSHDVGSRTRLVGAQLLLETFHFGHILSFAWSDVLLQKSFEKHLFPLLFKIFHDHDLNDCKDI